MPKQFYCAQCGIKLETTLKAIPQQGIVITVVKPHSCEETKEEDRFAVEPPDPIKEVHKQMEGKTRLETAFNSFNFVSKLNKAVEVEPMIGGPGDLRPKSSRREELATSTAPLSVLGRAPMEAGVTPPAGDEEKEFEDE